MPLEDEIIPDEKQGGNQNDTLHNLLDSAQNVLAEAVAKSAAEKVVDGMFSQEKHGNRGGPQQEGPPQEGLYPDLQQGNNQNKDPSFMDTAQNAFADALAKRTAEKLVDNIMPSNNSRQPEGNYGPSNQSGGNSGFDLGNLGSSLLESLAGQVMNPSDKQNPQQQGYSHQQPPNQGPQSSFDLGSLLNFAEQALHSQNQNQQNVRNPQAPGENQPSFDIGKVGSELLSSLAGQVLHPDNKAVNQQQQQIPHNQDNSQSGIDYSKVGAELLSSLAGQVLHPDKRAPDQQQQQLQNNQNSQSGIDYSKVGAELLESLAQQVLHPADKKENVSVQHQSTGQGNSPNQQGGGDFASIIGSLAENVLGGAKHNQEGQSVGSPTKPHTLADSAGEIATSVLGSLAESMLQKNSNDTQQYVNPNDLRPPPKWYEQGPQGYGPGPQGYGPGPQGYGPGPQGYGPGPQGYGPGPQGYGPGPQGYGPGPQGYGPGRQGYGPGPQGYGPGPQGYEPGPQGYGPPLSQGNWSDYQRGQMNPKEEQSSGDIGSLLLSKVADAIEHNPSSRKDHSQKKEAEEDESDAAEIGSFLVNSLASKMLQPRH